MAGRTCLVTGATNGIGYETALGLARAGAALVLVGRDAGRLRDAEARIRAALPEGRLEARQADLSSQAEIRRLAADVARSHDRLDVLVNNAGAIFDRREETVDGIERTWALDHLGYVLLTLELLDLLAASGRAGAAARIVNVASRAHERGHIDFDDIEGTRRYGAIRAYAQAKLGNVLFTYALARRLAGRPITVNALHPGVIRSGFARNTGGVLGFGWGLIRPFLSTPEAGAQTSLHLAVSPEVEGVSGRYFARCRAVPSSSESRDTGVQERVWALSLEQVGRG
ncbi:SDR family NAD(P)-dependent oxidoreductase [Methylobacterium radiodurans]|uniref:Short-chain dehydrogenase n=1 Tax=Methylobacterium radiodurans TaxID=2202828 RepID=A0A2U8W1A8_9HYPH|nr:SDR family NAD(P)-dependent oxidoreductase [Methylobacterium radiodurans]AWN39036.1 short-chain dehydrogenase [Methylobacterium radiodurans]